MSQKNEVKVQKGENYVETRLHLFYLCALDFGFSSRFIFVRTRLPIFMRSIVSLNISTDSKCTTRYHLSPTYTNATLILSPPPPHHHKYNHHHQQYQQQRHNIATNTNTTNTTNTNANTNIGNSATNTTTPPTLPPPTPTPRPTSKQH